VEVRAGVHWPSFAARRACWPLSSRTRRLASRVRLRQARQVHAIAALGTIGRGLHSQAGSAVCGCLQGRLGPVLQRAVRADRSVPGHAV
jgi:hypothetical protein